MRKLQSDVLAVSALLHMVPYPGSELQLSSVEHLTEANIIAKCASLLSSAVKAGSSVGIFLPFAPTSSDSQDTEPPGDEVAG